MHTPPLSSTTTPTAASAASSSSSSSSSSIYAHTNSNMPSEASVDRHLATTMSVKNGSPVAPVHRDLAGVTSSIIDIPPAGQDGLDAQLAVTGSIDGSNGPAAPYPSLPRRPGQQSRF
ncbi:hypothetical protein L1887_42370 [Cichorium endivia]|nr:hypothetical protein L1887_42370 [Cichorium endivia]